MKKLSLAGAAILAAAVIAYGLKEPAAYTAYTVIVDEKTDAGYITRKVRTVKGPDGVIWPGGIGQLAGQTVVADDDGVTALEPVAGLCACPPVKPSTCEAYDGKTWKTAAVGASLIQGTWRGGCVPKACAVMAGDQGKEWPPECGDPK